MTESSSNLAAEHATRRAFRFGRVRLAFLTSAASKALGFLVQFLAVPLAVKALGAERFGIYSILVSALTWIDLGRLGIGPGLTRGMAIAWNKDDRATEKKLFSNAFFLLVFMAALVGCLLTLLLSIGGPRLEASFGPSAARYRAEIATGAIFVVSFLMAQIVFSSAEAVRSAYQEDYVNNSMNLLGNVLALVFVLGVTYYWPTIQGFTIAVFGSIAISKGLNLIVLLGWSHRYLLPRWSDVQLGTIKSLLNTSFAFWVIQIATLMMQNFSLVLLGAKVGPETLAPYAVLFRLLQLLSTVVLMMTMPLWPAITDAVVRKDHDWIQNAYKRLVRVVMLFSACVALVIGVAGDKLVHLWVGNKLYVDKNLVVVLGIYFVIWMWNHSHAAVLFGLGRLWLMALTILAEGTLVLALGWALVPHFGNLGMAFSLCLAGVLSSGWILPMLVHHEFKSFHKAESV